MEKTATYETKCRRCGTLYEWSYGEIGQLPADESIFFKIMNSYIQHPKQSPCDVCEKDTVQDIVSYEIKDGQDG